MEAIYFSGRINPKTGETERVLIHQSGTAHPLEAPHTTVAPTVTRTDFYDPTLAGFYEPRADAVKVETKP